MSGVAVIGDVLVPGRDGERFDENFTIRISRSMRERIDRLAEREDRSAGYIARLALERGLATLDGEGTHERDQE